MQMLMQQSLVPMQSHERIRLRRLMYLWWFKSVWSTELEEHMRQHGVR